MKKRILALSALVLSSVGAFAQQDMLTTHFMFNKMTFNPASTGVDDGICGTMLYRNQWDRVNGAPNSALLNVEANLHPLGWSGGAGITFTHDAIGFNRQNNLLLNYSHHLITSQGTLGVGIGLGIVNLGLSPTWVPPVTLIDAQLPKGTAATVFDLNAGLFWKSALQPYYVGISSTHVGAPRLDDDSYTGTAPGAANGVTYNVARHYYLMGGYTFQDIFGTGKHLDAQALIRTELKTFSADISVRYQQPGLFYAGLMYRTSDAAAILAGITPIPNFTVGYSYDFTLNKLANVSRGSHEVMLRYCYYLPPPPRTPSKNPRYL